jgi:hypothetical protein
LVILETGSHFLPRLACTLILLFQTFLCCWADRHSPPRPTIDWDVVLQTICPSWPLTKLFLLLPSQLALITGGVATAWLSFHNSVFLLFSLAFNFSLIFILHKCWGFFPQKTFLFCLFSETGSHCAAQAGLELNILLP